MSKPLTDSDGLVTGDGVQSDNVLETLAWGPRPVLLKFRVGEKVLRYFRAPGLKNSTHVSAIEPIKSPAAPQVALRETGGGTILSCPITGRLPRLSISSGWLRYVTFQYRHQMVRISGSFEDFEQKWQGKTRSTIRRKVRKFQKTAGEDCFRIFRRPDEMQQFFDDARQVSALTYQERLLGQGIPDEESYRDELVERARREEFIGYMLYLQGRPVAYTAGDVMGPGVMRYGQTGYDPEERRLSPGTVLQYLLIQSLFEEQRFRFYDLCIGEDESKRLFSNFERDCADIVFMRATAKNVAVVLAHIVSEAINDAAVFVLERLGLKQMIKRAIRRSA